MRHLGLILLCITIAAIGLVAARPAHAAPAAQPVCPGNLLANPDFEGGSRKTESEGTSLSSAVADAWVPWFVRGNAQINREPEFKVEQVAIGGDRARIRSGSQSQKFFTTWGTHTAGMYQRVKVPAGATLQFTIYGMAYSGEADGFDAARGSFVSDPVQPGNYKMWAGVDPTGAVPPSMGSAPPESVVWSEPTLTTDQWVALSATVRANGGVVTVYAKGSPEWAVKHNDSFWEDACLTIAGRNAALTASAAGAAASVPSAAQAPAPKAPAAPKAAQSGAVKASSPTGKAGVAARYNPDAIRFTGNRPIPR